MIWLTMPTAILHAYAEMLPRLEAEKVLTDMLSAALGFGGAGDSAGKKIVSQLQRQARGDAPIPAAKRMSGRDFASMMGIPIRVKKKESKS